MEIVAHFLINLTGILVSLIVFQYFITKHYLKRIKIDIIIFFTLTVSILACMLFPLKLGDGIVFDLRFIPFILGCVYANRLTQVWMIGLILILRLYQGAVHSWFGILNIFLFYFISIYLSPTIKLLSKGKRISLFALVTLFLSIWSVAGSSLIFHAHYTNQFFLSYFLIQTGGMLIISYMVESINEQSILLKEMVKMKKLEAVSHLTASISHEVRNPLTATRGFLQLMSESPELRAEQKNYLEIAINQLDQADSIIRSYLTFAKPAPEKLKKINLKNETNKVLEILEPLAKMNCVEIQSRIEPSEIMGDEGLFQQAMVNMIQNGIEAMPGGGVLSVIGNIEQSQTFITITDEGIGMTPPQVSRLGEPYFTTKEAKGTGLGMMVVFRIIESMNGKIEIKSQLGKGTRITLQFPVLSN